jgi:hypothetical protein
LAISSPNDCARSSMTWILSCGRRGGRIVKATP